VVAGQGVDHIDGDKIVGEDGMPDAPFTLEGGHIEHAGYANVARRSELMSRAKAVFVPSYYLEPFGGVSIEPLFCGTPVITTDWGAFPENIIDGKVGYRVRTIGEAVWAAQNVDKLQPEKIRQYAVKNFSLDRVRDLYQAYFEQLYTLWDEEGFYSDWHDGTSKYHRYRRY
jgi:glycosyltransferase involved in cell wall biosynthesis